MARLKPSTSSPLPPVLVSERVHALGRMVHLHAAQPQSERVGGGVEAARRLAGYLTGRLCVAVLPSAHLQVEDARLGVRVGEVLQNDVLNASLAVARPPQLTLHCPLVVDATSRRVGSHRALSRRMNGDRGRSRHAR